MKITAFPIEEAVETVEVKQSQQKATNIKLEVYQQDWMPGFAAFSDDGSIQQGAPAHIGINIAALLQAVAYKELDKNDLPYVIAESLFHEFVHVLESWAGVEFNEERVEALLDKYRKQALEQIKKAKNKTLIQHT